ncbi:MAG: rhomboid family intramembrane serine protease [Geopsychrobacter sp.]|nr:rhomboid family intramembrane serine protease [Geopsychrobacter sp.]
MNHFARQSFFRRNTLRGHSLVQILIYINLGLFTLMVLHGTILGLQMSAIFNPPVQLLLHWGAQFWPLVIQQDQWWRCITYAYTHGGLIHIGFNMMVLYQVGPMIEGEIGWPRFFTLYPRCGITATIAGYFWHPMTPVVGASGAVFGLIGFSVSYYHRMGGAVALQHRNFMFQWAVMAFIFGLVVGADNAAHLGGLLSGAAFGWLVPTSIRGQRKTEDLFKILGWVCVALTALSIAAIPFSWM